MNGCAVEMHNRQGNRYDSVQARSHGIASNRDGGNAQRNAQNTQKKRLYFMSAKLPIKTRKVKL